MDTGYGKVKKKQGNFWLPRKRKECAPEFKTLGDYVIPRKNAIFKDFHESCHARQNQCSLKIAPYPLDPAASVYNWREDEVSHFSCKKKVLPLNCPKNVSQTAMSCLTSLVRRMWWCGRLAPLVRSIIRRRKARPATTTEQVKFKRPNKDCNS